MNFCDKFRTWAVLHAVLMLTWNVFHTYKWSELKYSCCGSGEHQQQHKPTWRTTAISEIPARIIWRTPLLNQKISGVAFFSPFFIFFLTFVARIPVFIGEKVSHSDLGSGGGGGAWTPKRPLAIYGTSGWDVPKRIIFFFFVFFCKSFRKSPRWLLSWFYYRKCPRHSVRVFFGGGGVADSVSVFLFLFHRFIELLSGPHRNGRKRGKKFKWWNEP